VREGVVFSSSRDLQSKGELSAAAAALAAHVRAHPGTTEEALELARVYLRMGHVNRAIVTVDAVPLYEAAPGLALRLGLERTWAGLVATFDVAGAVAEADRLCAGAATDGIGNVELADAERTRCRIIHAAMIYREVSAARSGEGLDALAAAASELLAAGWVEEGLSAALDLAQWQYDVDPESQAYRSFAENAERHGRTDYAADAVLREASCKLKAGTEIAVIRQILGRAQGYYAAASHELGLIDVAHIEALLRTGRLNAPVSELEDVLEAYARHDVPAREVSVAQDLSIAARHVGKLHDAKRYLARADTIAAEAGLLMNRAISNLTLAELALRGRDASDAIEICRSALQQSIPRVMRGTFEQLMSSAHSLSGDTKSARRHLQTALQIYRDAGARELASVAISNAINTALGGDEETLRAHDQLAHEWARIDFSHGDYEGAATKHQLRAQIALQLYRVSRFIAADPQILIEAEQAVADAVAAAGNLTGQTHARIFGNIAQITGQIAVWRNAPNRAETAYRNAVDIFDNSGLGLQAANSRYILGCMRLNASADASKRKDLKSATEHFVEAEQMLKAALAYYDENGMQSEAARTSRMLAQLYSNARSLAGDTQAQTLRSEALTHLSEAEAALDDIRAASDTGTLADARRGKSAAISESRHVYALAMSIESEPTAAPENLWTWHQKSRARTLTDAFSRSGGALRTAESSEQSHTTLISQDIALTVQIASARGAARTRLRAQRSQLRLAMSEYADLLDYLECATGQVPHIAGIRAMLADHADRHLAIVDFVTASDRIGVMVTTASGVKPVHWLRANAKSIQHLADEWSDWPKLRASLQDGSDALRGLDPLIAPLAELTAAGDHLILCPSGALAAFPLHALDIGGQPLIARNLVSYAPSIAVVRALIARSNRAQPLQDWVIADPSSDRPESRLLGERLARALAVPPITGREATQDKAAAALSGGRIVHFQGHAIFDRERPLRSRLILSDGEITAEDILGMTGIDTRLAVLGACEGAAVHMEAGDEPMGLAPALLVAGTQSVVAPLWPIDEGDAATFMDAFYAHLQATPHPCIAEAVRRTQLNLRAHSKFASPYSWAPYMLHGDWRL
jgi:CHAT domain-containing protein